MGSSDGVKSCPDITEAEAKFQGVDEKRGHAEDEPRFLTKKDRHEQP